MFCAINLKILLQSDAKKKDGSSNKTESSERRKKDDSAKREKEREERSSENIREKVNIHGKTHSTTKEEVKKMWLFIKDDIILFFIMNILIQT